MKNEISTSPSKPIEIKNAYTARSISDFDEMMAVIESGNFVNSLLFADDDLRNNPDVVRSAIKKNSADFMFASDSIKGSNEELMMLAIEGCCDNITHVQPKLQRNRNFVLKCVKKNCYVIITMDQRFRRDKEIMNCALKKSRLENFKLAPVSYINFMLEESYEDSVPLFRRDLLGQDECFFKEIFSHKEWHQNHSSPDMDEKRALGFLFPFLKDETITAVEKNFKNINMRAIFNEQLSKRKISRIEKNELNKSKSMKHGKRRLIR